MSQFYSIHNLAPYLQTGPYYGFTVLSIVTLKHPHVFGDVCMARTMLKQALWPL